MAGFLLFDMGLPMIMPTMYFMVLALVPIILIEAFYVSRVLAIRFKSALGSAAFGNIVSTIVGIPLTWFLLFIIQVISGGTSTFNVGTFARRVLEVTVQAPWILPFSREEFWVFHLAALFLLVPFFFATCLIEYVVMRNKLAIEVVDAGISADIPTAERMVFKAVRNANLISYALIALLLLVSLIFLAIGR